MRNQKSRYAIFALLIILSLVSIFYIKSWEDNHPRFKNNYSNDLVGFTSLIKWRWQKFNTNIPEPKIDLSLHKELVNLQQINRDNTNGQVTWLGHSSTLIQIDNTNILTDPIFSERASPVSFIGPKRYQKAGLDLEQLPKINIVLISHNHYDHLDLPSIKYLANLPIPPTFYLPLGVDKWFTNNIINDNNKEKLANKVIAMNWNDSSIYNNLQINFEPVQHWSARGIFDRKKTLWGSWVIQSQYKNIWFSGDLGYSQDIDDLAKKYPQGFDLSLIAIGAYSPSWFMKNQHINPQQAVEIHQKIKSKLSIGIHWGTFLLADESLDQPLIDLQLAKKSNHVDDNAFITLQHGQTKILD